MALTAAALALGLLVEPAAHPIHSTTLLLAATGPRQLSGELRAFVEDLPPGVDPIAVKRYLEERLGTGPKGTLDIAVGRIVVEGPVVKIGLVLSMPVLVENARLTNQLLQEKFPDQVNVVQVTMRGRTTTTVFVRGDRAKPVVLR